MAGDGMAHVVKYKRSALSAMCGHYERWSGDASKAAERENIDASKMKLNYNLAPEHEGAGQVHQ